MSQLNVDAIRHTGGTADNLTLDADRDVTVGRNLTVTGVVEPDLEVDGPVISTGLRGNYGRGLFKNHIDNSRYEFWNRSTNYQRSVSSGQVRFLADRWHTSSSSDTAVWARLDPGNGLGHAMSIPAGSRSLRHGIECATGASGFVRPQNEYNMPNDAWVISFYSTADPATFTIPASATLAYRANINASPGEVQLTSLSGDDWIDMGDDHALGNYRRYYQTWNNGATPPAADGTTHTSLALIPFPNGTVFPASYSLTGWQLERGNYPTEYEIRPSALEAQICARYFACYRRGNNVNTTITSNLIQTSGGQGRGEINISQQMRPGTPAICYFPTGSAANVQCLKIGTTGALQAENLTGFAVGSTITNSGTCSVSANTSYNTGTFTNFDAQQLRFGQNDVEVLGFSMEFTAEV